MKKTIKPEKSRIFLFFLLILILPMGLFAQNRTVSGKITDEKTNEPLVGVTIQIAGTMQGFISDLEGNYSVDVSESSKSLIFSYVGYETDTVMIGDRNLIDVKMKTTTEELDEVVVIGYGSIRKSDLTGSVSSVKAEDIVKDPTSNAISALQGKIAGLSVLSSSGNPGEAPIVRLRGITTLNNNNPIFVVDGVITDDISFLNSQDIQSIEVLKDASSTAIFGSRGSNGVIIITSKSGVSEKPQMNFSLEQGYESVAKQLDLMNRDEFVNFYNAITPGRYTDIENLPDIDWQNEVFKNFTPITNLNASVSGASDKFNYYLSGGYYSQEGIIPKSSFQRLTGKINTTYKVRDWMSLGLNLTVSQKEKQNPPGLIADLYRAFPINEPYNEDGSFAEVLGSSNPLATIEYSNSTTKSISSLGNLYAEIYFLKNFTLKSSYQFDVGAGKGTNFTPEFYVAPLQRNDQSSLTKSYSDSKQVIFEQTLSFDKEFNDMNRLNMVAGMSSQIRRNEYLNTTTKELLRDSEDFWFIDAGNQEFLEAGNNASESSLVSYLFRGNYALLNRYLFTATYRLDGSSNFGANNRYGHFPSAAFGWNISNEPFFPDLSFVDNIKYRISYGLVGNEKISANSQYETIGVSGGVVLGSDETFYTGASYTGSGNPFLKWETTKQFNTGIDVSLFERKIIGEFDFYHKETEDILVFLRPPGWAGLGPYSYVTFNAATVLNRGFEFKVNYRERIGNVNIDLGVLGTTIHNEVLSLAEDIGADSVINYTAAQTRVGQPIGYYYGYEVAGVFQTETQLERFPHFSNQGVGDFIYRDVNGDEVLNEQDRKNLGNSIPSFIYGFNIATEYKGLRLSLDFQGQYGNMIFNRKQQRRFSEHNLDTKFNDFWTGPGSTNENPKPEAAGVNYNVSDYFLEDGSFLRLKTTTLSYALPSRFLRELNARQINAYVRVTNLFTLSSFSGYSPDIGASNALEGIIDDGIYPVTRVFSIGLNINL
jgi:TonB-linked SusC/RagA family outer membrane protein